jgi:RNA polymerase II-associated factor 1
VDKWQVVHISHVPMSKEELDEREELLAEVTDPAFLLNRDDVDADGEIDVDALGHQATTGAIGDVMADIF